MKTLTVLLVLCVLGLVWTRYENASLRRGLTRASEVSDEQQKRVALLQKQLSVARVTGAANEAAQVELRQKLLNAGEREMTREQTIARLLNENESIRRWYNTRLPDDVRRLHQRAPCINAGDCLQRLPESHPMPDARQRP